MRAPTIRIVDAYLKYENQLLFQGFNLTLPKDKWTCLLGPSGVGKSSILRLIGGLKSSAHTVDPIRTSDNQPLHDRIAYLAQNETLLPWLTASENVLIGPKLRGDICGGKEIEKAHAFLEKVGLGNYLKHLPSQLSGGMKQRVLLARTLFENKPVILMDEPFGALDVITRASLQELAFELLSEKTVLLVTHDPMEAMRLGHQIYVMYGRPAGITPIQLSSYPLRQLTNSEVLQTQAMILNILSHTQEVTQC